MKTDFHQIINTIIKKVIELVKKYIRVILIGVLCMGVILSIFSIINYRHSKSLKDKIIKKCNDDTEIIIHMSDFTGFEWDKCIVYGPSTQTKDICDAFDINYNTYLDLNYGIIFLNNNDVTYEEFFKVSGYDFTNKIPEFIISSYSMTEQWLLIQTLFYSEIQKQKGKSYGRAQRDVSTGTKQTGEDSSEDFRTTERCTARETASVQQ